MDRSHNSGHCVVSTVWSQPAFQRRTFPIFGGNFIASRRPTISTLRSKTTRIVCAFRVCIDRLWLISVDDEHARALEEQWIDSMDSVGNAPLVQTSAQSMILRGIVMGFFFPILPLFFLRDAKPAAFWNDGSEVQPTENVIFPYVAAPFNDRSG